ncbi:hypothetical protein SCYAM73S_06752 [Streptomyces cyaneofuscatus]|nr:hypothetical protein STIB_38210 [Streptomyces sp. IB2014 011-1]
MRSPGTGHRDDTRAPAGRPSCGAESGDVTRTSLSRSLYFAACFSSCRRTISAIHAGANGDVQFGGVG